MDRAGAPNAGDEKAALDKTAKTNPPRIRIFTYGAKLMLGSFAEEILRRYLPSDRMREYSRVCRAQSDQFFARAEILLSQCRLETITMYSQGAVRFLSGIKPTASNGTVP